VESNWTSAIFHAAQPESIDAALFANNSCLPPTASGYLPSQGCRLGGLPSYVVNISAANFNATVDPLMRQLQPCGSDNSLTVSLSSSQFANHSSFYDAISGRKTAGSGGVMSSRLLGRPQLSDLPLDTIQNYLKRAVKAQNATAGTYATIGLSGGPGVINQPSDRWGSLIPAWRSAYLHLYVGGESGEVNDEISPSALLASATDWTEENKEALWQEWAPEMGAYMNEANPYN
jgi:hypothetical protein